jgi:hypothetical protein
VTFATYSEDRKEARAAGYADAKNGLYRSAEYSGSMLDSYRAGREEALKETHAAIRSTRTLANASGLKA